MVRVYYNHDILVTFSLQTKQVQSQEGRGQSDKEKLRKDDVAVGELLARDSVISPLQSESKLQAYLKRLLPYPTSVLAQCSVEYPQEIPEVFRLEFQKNFRCRTKKTFSRHILVSELVVYNCQYKTNVCSYKFIATFIDVTTTFFPFLLSCNCRLINRPTGFPNQNSNKFAGRFTRQSINMRKYNCYALYVIESVASRDIMRNKLLLRSTCRVMRRTGHNMPDIIYNRALG